MHGVGVLIRGVSGSGKSATALTLMNRGHRLVADDLVEVAGGAGRCAGGKARGTGCASRSEGARSLKARTLFPHGVIRSSRIDVVADLDAYDPPRDAGRIEPDTRNIELLNKTVLAVRIPLASGMDPALLIEMLALAGAKPEV